MQLINMEGIDKKKKSMIRKEKKSVNNARNIHEEQMRLFDS
jgi:hypothetical protein